MKNHKLVLPVLAAAAFGISLPALSGRASAYLEAKQTEVKVGPVSVMTMAQAPAAPQEQSLPLEASFPSLPYVSIAGIQENDLQLILNEALSFKGTDAEFAKKAAVWKEKYGFTVTRKGPGHIVLSKGEGKSSTRVEIHQSGSSPAGTRIAPNSRPLTPSGTARTLAPDSRPLLGTERSRTFGPNSRIAPMTDGVRVFSPSSRGLTDEALKQIEKEIKGIAGLKSLTAQDKAEVEKALAEIQKSLKELEGIKIVMPNLAEVSAARSLTDKERAAVEKELAEARKTFRITPGSMGKEAPEISVFGTTAPGFRFFYGSSNLQGLSEADRKKMNDELAKVQAESKKKMDGIIKKYEEKAKKSGSDKK